MQQLPIRFNPILMIAAISVVIASATATAFFAGWIPGAHGQSSGAAAPSAVAVPSRTAAPPPAAPAARTAKPASAAPEARVTASAGLGRVESINTVVVKGQASGVGAVAGGVGGALLGSTMGQGNGKTAMTVLGAAGGALAGNEIEKSVKRETRYDVVVRMDDGSTRTVHFATLPDFRSGDRVRVQNGRLVPAA